MKPVIRWPSARTRSQLLSRKSYKPDRVNRIRPTPKLAGPPGRVLPIKPKASTARWLIWFP
jgi:hypothetical protein